MFVRLASRQVFCDGFGCNVAVSDWLLNFKPNSQPIRGEGKTNQLSLASIFPRSVTATRISVELVD